MLRDCLYFVYLLNSSSRRVLYTGVTNALVTRVLEHREAKDPRSFTAQYRAFRLVYYEEYSDVRSAIAREKRIKGWTRAKKDALVRSMNPQWRDLVSQWEKKYGIKFEINGVFRAGEGQKQQQLQHQRQPQGPSAKGTPQDDRAF
jgi:putative endonuclease